MKTQGRVALPRTRRRVDGVAIGFGIAGVASLAAVMVAKREIALAGIEVCDLAMEVAGGGAFFRGSVVERCYRDMRAAKFHPTTPEDTLLLAADLAWSEG